jgi:hypothetical protein
MKLNYQIYNEKWFCLLNSLEKNNDFLKNKIHIENSKIILCRSESRDFLFDLFKKHCPLLVKM